MRPDKKDYAPFYAGYVDALAGDNGIEILTAQNLETQELLNSFSESKGNYAYAEGKWTVKEVVGHLIDAERIFAYRALCIARGEKQSLPGYDQNEYVKTGNFNSRELFDLNYEFRLLRESNILLFRGFDEFMLNKRGVANNFEVTVRALLFIIAGHEKHHIKILKERYLGN
ncbi:MAG: DinB family protein [Ignavibacteriales bacterium]|nr:MAG: DinB family protein [Ignavibacteriales bacterium]